MKLLYIFTGINHVLNGLSLPWINMNTLHLKYILRCIPTFYYSCWNSNYL